MNVNDAGSAAAPRQPFLCCLLISPPNLHVMYFNSLRGRVSLADVCREPTPEAKISRNFLLRLRTLSADFDGLAALLDATRNNPDRGNIIESDRRFFPVHYLPPPEEVIGSSKTHTI
jgi:hypothetical protein